jgi:hypothetical protein
MCKDEIGHLRWLAEHRESDSRTLHNHHLEGIGELKGTMVSVWQSIDDLQRRLTTLENMRPSKVPNDSPPEDSVADPEAVPHRRP